MNLDCYMDRRYNGAKYNCAHFVCDVWLDLTGQDISGPLAGFLAGPSNRKADAHRVKALARLEAPQTPCLALFQANRKDPHIGVWIDGKILHISESGVKWSCLEMLLIQFNQVRFYNVKKSDDCRKLA